MRPSFCMVAAHYLNQGSDWNSIKEKKTKTKIPQKQTKPRGYITLETSIVLNSLDVYN